ncbi:hypothetical protein ACFY8W_34365 [Streptomyces sp. NPDC012637]|uniref:hypothetical protein n=1 Tax=Streptomyces sp. NPDC012637 TaxID=3364842 RepID=UPI0036E6BADE
MRNLIAHTLGGILIPALLWLLTLTLPPTGRHRTRAAQRRRRRALWLATVGVDIDHRDIHALAGVAR